MMKAKLKLAKFSFYRHAVFFFSSNLPLNAKHLKMFRPVKESLEESIISEYQWFNIH